MKGAKNISFILIFHQLIQLFKNLFDCYVFYYGYYDHHFERRLVGKLNFRQILKSFADFLQILKIFVNCWQILENFCYEIRVRECYIMVIKIESYHYLKPL